MKLFYLVMAVLGTVLPYVFFGQFIAQEGLDIPLFVKSLFVNGASGGFTADLLISSFVLWGWAYHDARQRDMRRWWVIIPANLLVGLSLSLPLYLYMRHNDN
ncbi:MAG: DUF2834 domain-containing protein [Anaerolineae bacterium]